MRYNHISAPVPGVEGHFLLNAHELAYDEITVSSISTVDLAGNIIDAPDPINGINLDDYVNQSAVHETCQAFF
jgi:ribulose-5-phosphate 4-epimerase/fuculose-1-phosphate aldolase